MLQVTAGRRPWRRAVVAATIAGCPADAGRRARTFQNSTSSSKDGSSSSTNSARWLGPLTDSVAPMYLAANASCEFLSIWPVRSVTSKLSAAAGASTSRGGRAPMSSGSIQPQSIAVRTASASDVGCGTRTISGSLASPATNHHGCTWRCATFSSHGPARPSRAAAGSRGRLRSAPGAAGIVREELPPASPRALVPAFPSRRQ